MLYETPKAISLGLALSLLTSFFRQALEATKWLPLRIHSSHLFPSLIARFFDGVK